MGKPLKERRWWKDLSPSAINKVLSVRRLKVRQGLEFQPCPLCDTPLQNVHQVQVVTLESGKLVMGYRCNQCKGEWKDLYQHTSTELMSSPNM